MGTPSCDPAPQTTSFGTVGQWERRQQAMVPSTRASTLGPGVAGWALLRCDLAPQSTSFGTMALRERQHLAMTPSTLSSTHSNASLLVLLARAFGLSSSLRLPIFYRVLHHGHDELNVAVSEDVVLVYSKAVAASCGTPSSLPAGIV